MTSLTDLLAGLDTSVKTTLENVPTVDEDSDLDAEDIPGQGSNRWVKVPEVVAVVCDLKASTSLGTGKHDTSTARIYRASVEGAVAILHEFEADFIDIQGDGGFGLYWGCLLYTSPSPRD